MIGGIDGVIECIHKIDALGEIKYLAVHVRNDPDFKAYSFLRMEDVDGNVFELPAFAEEGHQYGDEDHCQVAVVANCMIEKAFGQKEWISRPELQIGDPGDIYPVFNRARKLKPYKGVFWINEKKARRYEFICPEYIF